MVQRRLELLKMEGLGFSKPEIVKHLAKQHKCRERTIYYDFQRRGQWQPVLQELQPEKSLLKIVNRYEHIYRKAALKLVQCQNESVQIGALRVMLESTRALLEVTNPRLKEGVGEPKPDKIMIRWLSRDDPEYMKEKARCLRETC